jgi:DNA replication protein DnaC
MLATRGCFRTSAEVEDWDGNFIRVLSKQRFKELALLNFYGNQQNLILLGKTGEGKTLLAPAPGRKLCAEGIKTTFLPVNLLLKSGPRRARVAVA